MKTLVALAAVLLAAMFFFFRPKRQTETSQGNAEGIFPEAPPPTIGNFTDGEPPFRFPIERINCGRCAVCWQDETGLLHWQPNCQEESCGLFASPLCKGRGTPVLL